MDIRTLPPDDGAPAQAAFASTASVRELVEGYLQAYRPGAKEAALGQLAKTEPRDSEDIRWLLHLYRNGSPTERKKVEESLSRLSPTRQEFAPYFLSLIQDSEPAYRNFGIYGSFLLRNPQALPELHKIVSEPFPVPEVTPTTKPLEASGWALQYQTLELLAVWEGPEVWDLLLKKSKQAPRVSSLIASLYWERALPEILDWSESSSSINAQRAKFAWNAPVPVEKLRSTSDLLQRAVLDSKKKLETRHQAAIKLGSAAEDKVVDSLLKEYQDAKDPQTRLILNVALFASHNRKVVPLLVEYAKTNPSPIHRAGALVQLKDMVSPKEYLSLLQWMAAHDPDEENRRHIQRELQSLK